MAIIEGMKYSNLNRTGRGLAALALIAGAPAVLADNLSWTAGDGAWENTANWSGGALPTAADFVDITHTGAVTSTATGNVARELLNKSALSVSAGRLTVDGTIETAGLLSVSGAAKLDAGRITITSDGGLDIDTHDGAVKVIEGVFNHGSWHMTGNHNATISAESFDNFDSFIIEGSTGVNPGTATATANSMINHADATALVTGAGSTLVIHGDITNDGDIQVTNAGELHAKSIDNNVTMVVDKGKVQLDSQINLGSLKVTGEGGQYSADDVVTNHGSVEAKDVRVKFIAGEALPLQNEIERIGPGETVSTSFSFAFTGDEGYRRHKVKRGSLFFIILRKSAWDFIGDDFSLMDTTEPAAWRQPAREPWFKPKS